jgi:hypothetical protein
MSSAWTSPRTSWYLTDLGAGMERTAMVALLRDPGVLVVPPRTQVREARRHSGELCNDRYRLEKDQRPIFRLDGLRDRFRPVLRDGCRVAGRRYRRGYRGRPCRARLCGRPSRLVDSARPFTDHTPDELPCGAFVDRVLVADRAMHESPGISRTACGRSFSSRSAMSVAACGGIGPSPEQLTPFLLGQDASRDLTRALLPYGRFGDDRQRVSAG